MPVRAVDGFLRLALRLCCWLIKGMCKDLHCDWTPSYVCFIGRIALCFKPRRCNGHDVSILLAVSKKERAWE